METASPLLSLRSFPQRRSTPTPTRTTSIPRLRWGGGAHTLTRRRINAALPVEGARTDLASVRITWQIVVGALAGVAPFVVAGIEFSKRIIAQRKCEVCGCSGLVLKVKDKTYACCPSCGANGFGQLGDGTEESRKHPKKVKSLQSEYVKSVSCGAHCTAAIAEPRENDGTVSTSRLWIWGQNQGSNHPRLFWGAFAPDTVIRQVSCGATHVVVLSEEGLLQAWGYNEYGQLGRGFTSEGLQRAQVLNVYAKFLDEPPELVKIRQVVCGEYHTAAISEDGEVYTWGLGSMGQLGHCSLQSPDKELLPRRVVALDGISVKDVACGGVHTCALTAQGALYTWGGGQAGQLGLGPQNGFFSCVPNSSDMMLRNLPVLVIPNGVRLVTCGHSHTLVSMKDGKIYGWGYNSYGQATNEKSTYAWFPSPIDWCVGEVRRLAAGGGHSAVLTDAYTLKELCEFRLAESVNLSNCFAIADVASRTGADSLARLCERYREHLLEQGNCDNVED